MTTYAPPAGKTLSTDQIAVGQDGALYVGAQSATNVGALLRVTTQGQMATYNFQAD
jgi:hypothetical protein